MSGRVENVHQPVGDHPGGARITSRVPPTNPSSSAVMKPPGLAGACPLIPREARGAASAMAFASLAVLLAACRGIRDDPEEPRGLDATESFRTEAASQESGHAVTDRLSAFDQLDTSVVPPWSPTDLSVGFEKIRDERFLLDDTRPDWPRRLTWLHPQRGCEARAQLVADKLAEWGYARPAKIFVSGNLHAWTDNDPSGKVAWDWHVAAAVRVEDDVFVFDPALEPRRPLPLEEWLSLFSPDVTTVRVAACDPAAFEPETRCMREEVDWSPWAVELERKALGEEWQLQVDLGRDPERVLGEAPPWRESALGESPPRDAALDECPACSSAVGSP